MLHLNRSILAALSFMLFSVIAVAAQEQDRLIEQQSNPYEPVKIAVVKTRRGPVVPGKKFSGDNDWFKGLTVSVTNNSGKPITYVGVRLTFPRPEDNGAEHQPPFVDNLEYGISPFVEKSSLPTSLTPPRPINPGETVDLTLSDYWFDRYKRALTKTKYPASIKRIEILVEEVGFSDDTVWTLGVRYRRNPSNPREWIQIEEPQGRARLPSAKYAGITWLNLIPKLSLPFSNAALTVPYPTQSTTTAHCGTAQPTTSVRCTGSAIGCNKQKTTLNTSSAKIHQLETTFGLCKRSTQAVNL